MRDGVCDRPHGAMQRCELIVFGDNAHAESFFHSLTAELTRGITFATERMLRRQLEDYLRYDNTVRVHASLQYLSPLAFERRTA